MQSILRLGAPSRVYCNCDAITNSVVTTRPSAISDHPRSGSAQFGFTVALSMEILMKAIFQTLPASRLPLGCPSERSDMAATAIQWILLLGLALVPSPAHSEASGRPSAMERGSEADTLNSLPASAARKDLLEDFDPMERAAEWDTSVTYALPEALDRDVSSGDSSSTGAPAKKPDVVFVPTPDAVVNKMLEMAEIHDGDVVYDLGCGDGRIVVAAAKRYGVKAFGFDIDPRRVEESLANVRSNKVEHLVTIQQADIFTLDLRPADVVTLYLLPELNVRLMPQLARMKPGSRIVSHDFSMGNALPVEVDHVTIKEGEPGYRAYSNGRHTIFKWIVPWQQNPNQP